MGISTELIRTTRERYAGDRLGVHGWTHWVNVARNARNIRLEVLQRGKPAPDIDVTDHFALLHDCCRRDDGDDPGHGMRAAGFAQDCFRRGLIDLTPEQMDRLVYAIAYHSAGMTSKCPTVGACWDADRLDLRRLGMRIDRRFISDPMNANAYYGSFMGAHKLARRVHNR